MKTPSRSPPASRGTRSVPGVNSPTSLVKPPAKENKLGKGRYSPKGTRWALSYRAFQSPSGEINAAELKIAGAVTPGDGAAVPIAPVIVQAPVWRAMSLIGTRNLASLVKNGAGDSGQTIRSIFAEG